jgi:N-sulfoglucosamine sulfohydrolase
MVSRGGVDWKMTRRTFAGAAAAPLLAQSNKRPNLLLILSDDHSVPYLGCYGDPAVRTPNLDRFASEGMRLDRCFTAAPQCVPSRTAIMTGRSPVAARMGRFSSPLPPDVVSLPELLRTAGYYTGIAGRSFHLDGARRDDVSIEIAERHKLATFAKRVDFLDSSGQPNLEARFQEFFDRRRAGQPYFLWANFSDPHHVWDTDAVQPPIDPAAVKVPAYLPDLPGVRADLARHLGEISRMDGLFQKLIDIVRKRGDLDNTLVLFMGDNGMAFPHGKGSLYDPGLNVPLLARWPGKIKPGGTSRALISGEDITPTMLDAAGIDRPPVMTGISQLPVLTGQSSAIREHIFGARLYHGNSILTENTKASTWDQSRCVRSGKYKLIYNATGWMEYWPVDSGNDPGWREMVAAHAAKKLPPEMDRTYFSRPRPIWELYDLDEDPAELHNLADAPAHADTVRRLKVALQEKMMIDYDFLPLPIGP